MVHYNLIDFSWIDVNVERDEHESNNNSTDKDQNDEKCNNQQFIDKS